MNTKNKQKLALHKQGSFSRRMVAVCALFVFKIVRNTLLTRVALLAVASLVVPSGAFLTALNSDPVLAQTPNTTLNYQARILQSSGTLVPDGFYNAQFRLYDDPAAGTLLWTETYYDSNGVSAGNDNRIRVLNGYLTTNLGSLTSFPSTIDWSEQLYLTINIGGTTQTATPTWDGEMSPRLSITATPYSFVSAVSRAVASADTSTALTDSGDVSITTGDATGTASNSGDITIDTGAASNGTNGVVNIGNSNASSILFGNSSSALTLTGNSSSTFVLNGITLSTSELTVLDNGIEAGDLITQGTATDEYCLSYETGGGALLEWQPCATGSGVTTIGALDGGTPNANGAFISGTTLYLQSASGTQPGLVTTGAQTFAGNKTFTSPAVFWDLTITAGESLQINSEWFNDLTGSGLTNTGGALTVDTSALSSTFFTQNGNSFTANAVLGTNDAYDLELETSGTTRLTIDAATGDVAINNNLTVGTGPSYCWFIFWSCDTIFVQNNQSITATTGNFVGSSTTLEADPSADGNTRILGQDINLSSFSDFDINYLAGQSINLYQGGAGDVGQLLGSVIYVEDTAGAGTVGSSTRGQQIEIYSGAGSATAQVVYAQSSGANQGLIIGTDLYLDLQSSGTVNEAAGLRIDVNVDATTDDAWGVQVLDAISGGGTLWNYSGISIANQTGASNNTNLLIGTSNAPSGNYSIYSTSTYASYLAGALTIDGLTTLNGGLTVETGDTFTFNGDAFTDFTGGGLANVAGVLTVDVAGSSGFFQNGGNSFGVGAVLGTNDAFGLSFETNNTTALSIDTSQNTTVSNNLNVNGNTTLGDATGDTVTFTGRVNSDILPSTDDTYDLGSSSLRWQDLYLGPASLHVYCNAAECGTARDWSLGVIETAGATQGNLRLGLGAANSLVVSTTGNVGINNTNPSVELDVTGQGLFSGLLTLNGGLTIQATDTFTFNSDAFTDLTGTGLQINAGALEAVVGSTIETGEITNATILGEDIAAGAIANSNLANSQLAVNSGSGLQGGGNISLGGSRTLSLGDLTADWTQAGAYDIILNNPGSEIRILEASGGLYYGEFDVADLNGSRLYTFPDASGEVSLLGQTIDNVELTNSAVTITSSTGLSGGGAVSLGGSVALSVNLGDDIDTSEILNDTILAVDLDTTNVLGAGLDGYVYTYNNTTGNFTLVDPSTIGAAGGVSSLNTLTGALTIAGTSQISVTPSGSNINLAIPSNSITATQIGANAVSSSELASTTVGAGSYGSGSSVATFTVDADGRLTAAGNQSISIAGTQITSGTVADSVLSSNVALLDAVNTFTAAGTALTVNNNATISGTLTVGDISCSDCLEAGNIATGAVATAEILNNTILASDLDYTNGTFGAGQDGYVLTYDNTTGGFTWVDGGTLGSTLSEAQVEAYIFDADNTGTLSSGTLALNSLSYTGNLTVAQGGTGITAAGAAGGVYYSTGTAFANSGAGTAGQCLLSNGAGAPSWGNCGGSGAGAVTLQVAYDQGNSITTTNARDLTFTLANTTTDANFLVNIATSSTGKIAFQLNGTDLLRIDSAGIDLLDVDVADFTGATVTFDAGEILETEIAQNTLDDSEIQDNSLSAASLATGSVGTDEVIDNTIQEIDLEVTNAPVNTYVLTYDSTSGGFTWVSQASVAGAGGVTSLNSLTGGVSIAGNSQISVGTAGSNVNLAITGNSIGDAQLAFDTGQNLTTASTPTFAGLLSNGQIQANAALNQIAIVDADTTVTEWTISTASDDNFALLENGINQRLLLTAGGDLTVTGDGTFSGGNITVGSTNISESDIDALDDGLISLTTEISGTLQVGNGGTGVTSLANGILLGNGASAISSTGVLTNGQLLIGDGSGNPTVGTLSNGTGITVTNGAGTITITSTLGTTVDSTELVDNSVQEIDLEVTNAPTAGYILSYDSGTGGFTWINPAGAGADEATVESYIFDGDNTGTLSSGTLALNSLNYTGSLSVGYGGTGITAAGSAGGVFYSTGTAFANSGAGTSGQCLLSNGAGAPSWGNCGGSGSGATTLQVAYDNGNNITTTNARNIEFDLADTATDAEFLIDLQGAGNRLVVQDGGVENFVINGAGNVGIGATPGSFKLDVTGSQRISNNLTVNGNTTLGDTTSDTVSVAGDITIGGNDILFAAGGGIQGNTNNLYINYGLGSSDNLSYEFVGFFSGTTREGIILYDGAWSGCSNVTNEFCIKAEASNTLTLQGSSTTGVLINDTLSINGNTVLTGTLNVSSSITAGDFLCNNCIDAGALAANSVGSSEIAANAVGQSEIATDGVAAAEIAAGAVGTSEVANNSLTASDLAASSVGNSEINNAAAFTFGSVTSTGTIRSNNGEIYTYNGSNYTRIHNNGTNAYIDSANLIYLRPMGGVFPAVHITAVGNATNNNYLCWNASRAIAGCSSSIKMKHDVTDITYDISDLRQIRPVSYKWNEDNRADGGFIAEEVSLIIPETTQYDANGDVKHFNDSIIVGLAVKSIQQLDVQVQDNTAQINNIKNRLNVLESPAGNLTKANLTVIDTITTTKLSVTDTAEVVNLKVSGKIISTGISPTITADANAGIGATVNVEGNDIAGSLTLTTGNTALTGGQQVIVTFNTPYATSPRVTITPTNSNAAASAYFVTKSVNSFNIHFVNAPTAASQYSFDYQIIQ